MNNQKSCPNCGTQFKGRSNQTYCSSRCKTQAFRANKPLDEAPPIIPPVSANRPVQPVSPRLDKTAVEVERLRLLNAERIKEMEYNELDRQRQFEADQQKRRFEEEREREEWRTDSNPPASDPSPILRRLDELSSQLVSSKDDKPEDKEETSTPGNWETPALILGGLVLGALFLSGKPQPPTKPPVQSKPSLFPPIPPKTKPPVAESEPNQ